MIALAERDRSHLQADYAETVTYSLSASTTPPV